VAVEGDGPGSDPERAAVVGGGGGSRELDRLAVHAPPDHLFPKYPIAAKPEAPASAHAAALGASTPPMASTGIATHRATSLRASSPTGCCPGWEALAKTGPKTT